MTDEPRDLTHMLPRKDQAQHIRSEHCPCKPAKLVGHDGVVTIWAHKVMDAPPPEEPDAIARALAAWMEHADLYLEGNRVQENANLVGTPENAREYAEIIGDWIRDHGTDQQALTDYLVDPTGAARRFRCWSFAPAIAEGALRMLRERGLI